MLITVKVIILATVIAAAHCVDLIVKNNEIGPIWIGIAGNTGKPTPSKGGAIIESFANKTISVPEDWSGRLWARTWCYPETKRCDTGDCGSVIECNGKKGTPPATLIEIALKADEGKDTYEISLVEGFNLKASIEPIDGQGKDGPNACKRIICDYYINDECPDELKLVGPHASFVIACKSACVAFKTDEYCSANTSNSSGKPKHFTINYPAFFKKRCPDARTHINDNKTKTPTCNSKAYLIIFG